MGIKAALVNAGGDLRSFGLKPGKKPFRIGIQNPDNAQSIVGILRVTDCAVATSGDYERFFKMDGKRWHHILDPKTGRPGRLTRSVTVIAQSTMMADGLATAFFVMGPKAAIDLANGLKDIEAAIIAPNKRFYMSRGFSKYLEKEK